MMRRSLPLSPPCHVIHLRGHWRHIRRSNGSCCWERMFGRPMHLDAQERVWLVANNLPPGAHVQINEHEAGRTDYDGSWVMDITALLQLRNRLRIILSRTTDAPGGGKEDGSRPTPPGTSRGSDISFAAESFAAEFMVALHIYGPDNSSP